MTWHCWIFLVETKISLFFVPLKVTIKRKIINQSLHYKIKKFINVILNRL